MLKMPYIKENPGEPGVIFDIPEHIPEAYYLPMKASMFNTEQR